MEYGNSVLESQSPRCRFSTEENNERQNYHPFTIEEETIPDWFYLPYCDGCKTYREFWKNACSYQLSHKVSLSCVICENVYTEYYYSCEYYPTC